MFKGKDILQRVFVLLLSNPGLLWPNLDFVAPVNTKLATSGKATLQFQNILSETYIDLCAVPQIHLCLSQCVNHYTWFKYTSEAGGHLSAQKALSHLSTHSRPNMYGSMDTHTLQYSYILYYILSVSRRGYLHSMLFSCCLFSKYSMWEHCQICICRHVYFSSV